MSSHPLFHRRTEVPEAVYALLMEPEERRFTLSETSPDRRVLIHYHIFKNAGTSIERSLDRLFGRQLYRIETDSPDGHLAPPEAHRLISDNPDLLAITSHQLHPPAPSGPYRVFPLVILREPISRVRSAYLFEWQRQLGLDEPKGTLAEYVQLKLDSRGPGVIGDFQVSHLAREMLHERGARRDDMEAGLELAIQFVDSIPTFGLVERFAESIDSINRELRAFYGHDRVQIEYRHDNVTQGTGRSVEAIHELMREELGDALYAELRGRNEFDLELYRRAVERFDRTVAVTPQPEEPDRIRSTGSATEVVEPGPGGAEVVRDELDSLRRRVHWQDQILHDVTEARKAELAELDELKTKFTAIEQELTVSKAVSVLPTPTSTVPSRVGRFLDRLERKLSGITERYRVTEHVGPEWEQQLQLIATSGLFDPTFYAETNPDVVEADVNLLDHYLRHGGLEGRAASPQFDSGRYLRQYPDVGRAGLNPLVHYLLHGREEGRRAFTLDGTLIDAEPCDLPQPADFERICRHLRFDEHQPGRADPDVSIVIPIYNAVDYTIACLEAVRALRTGFRYEVIVMDDCSTDSRVSVLQSVVGLRYVRNDRNLGFLRNCNRGAELARGRFVVFLNNDTRVDEDWLDPLVETLLDDPTIGLVGSKLIYPDGRLQEAGGIIFQNGSGWNYGRFEDPNHPDYNHARDVDYVSGASIMVERSYFRALGGFDERFAPAYYEDTDLCFRIRADGRRVVYQPLSSVVHYEGISSGTDLTSGVKMHQAINRHEFAAKWETTLKADHRANADDVAAAADRLVKGHVLVIDATTPTPDQDSGSIDMFNMLAILTDLGYRVHFVPAEGLRHNGGYTEELQRLGVKCIHEPYYRTLSDYLEEVGDIFELVLMARVNVAGTVVNEVLLRCPSARTVFYTVDLHFVRLQRKAELLGDRQVLKLAEAMKDTELAIMDVVDTTVVLSESERRLLSELGKTNVAVIPLIRAVSTRPIAPFGRRSGAVFVGGFRHPPNVDAVEWLVSDIWPLVREHWYDATGSDHFPLRIIGSNIVRRFKQLADDVEVYGFVENLEPILSQSLLTVAPLRYGAGLKGKVATSLDFGLPVVGTSVAFEGMPMDGLDDIALVGDDAETLARRIVEIATSPDRWQAVSEAGRCYLERHYSLDAVTPLVADLFGPPAPR